MVVGATLMDDVIDVYVWTGRWRRRRQTRFNIETLKDLGMNIFTNYEGNGGITFFLPGK